MTGTDMPPEELMGVFCATAWASTGIRKIEAGGIRRHG